MRYWYGIGALTTLPERIPGFAGELVQYSDRDRLIEMVRAILDAMPWSVTAQDRAVQFVDVLTPLIEGGGRVIKEDAMSNIDPTSITGPVTDVQLQEMTFAPETAEEAYRRAYQDGFLAGADTLDDLIRLGKLKPEEAFALCEDFFWDELALWRGTNTNELVPPPDLPMPALAERSASRTKFD